MTSATYVARLIQRTVNPDGMTLIQSNEHAAGQTVFHVHLHLVPRWNGDNVIEPWRAKGVDDGALASTRSKILEDVVEKCE